MTAQIETPPGDAQSDLTSATSNDSVASVSNPINVDDALLTRPKVGHWRRYFWVVLCLLLLLVGYYMVRLGGAAWSLYDELRTLQANLLPDAEPGLANLNLDGFDLNNVNLADLGPQMGSISERLGDVDRAMAFFTPLLRRLTWVPKVGPTVAASPELLAGATHGIRLAADALSLLAPAIQPDGKALVLDPAEILDALADSPEAVDAMALTSEQMVAELASVEAATLYPPLGLRLAQIQPYLPLLPSALRMTPAASNLLGMDAPRHYLVLVQNNHELRATGGFLTAVGALVIQDGTIAELTFQDSYRVTQKELDLPPAPAPMQRYMGIQLLTLRDANWSPDLPTAARTIQAIYAQDTGIRVDGIVTLDLAAAELLVNAVAPLTVEGADEPLTGETLLEQILAFWSTPLDTGDTLAEAGLGKWWGQRKDFMPKLADAALGKVQRGEVAYAKLLDAGVKALNQRSIQIWLDEPAAAAELAHLDWDGAIRPQPGADFFALVDSNLGYNKVDFVLQRSVNYGVTWPKEGEAGIATATVIYDHPLESETEKCDLTPRYGITYEDMAARCYFDYARLYVPQGSELIAADGFAAETLETGRGEQGTQLFSGYFVLKPGEQQELTFTYQLPPEIQPDDYQLLVRRQSGTPPLSLTLAVGAVHDDLRIQNGQLLWSPEKP